MCGIATIAIGRGSRGRIPYEKLRGLTRELLIELSSRGQDASGIAVINQEDCFVFKKPLRPKRLVVRPRFEDILNRIGPSTNFIMLHSRSASVGGNEENYNNHPIIADPIIGIHNGTLCNDPELFRRFKKEFKAEGDVDSEVIFRMWNMYMEKGLSPINAFKAVTPQLDGAFTGAAVDMRRTHQMLLFRYERTLHLLRVPHYDMVISVSEIQMYDAARNRMKLKMKDNHSIPKEEMGYLFDLDKGKITENLEYFKMPVMDLKNRQRRWSSWASCGFVG